MKERITLDELKDELSTYNHFSLELDDSLKTVGLHMEYDDVYVALSTYPCISFKNRYGRANLKHICFVERENNDAEFNVRCKEYLGMGKYIYTNYRLVCCAE